MRQKESFNEPGGRRFHVLACLVIVVTGLIVYSNTIHSSFQFDDYKNIVDNTAIRDLHNIPLLFKGEGPTAASRAIPTATFAVNYYLGGCVVDGYRWVNISIHLLNGLLVYWFVLLTLDMYFYRVLPNHSTVGNHNPSSEPPIFETRKHDTKSLALFVALLFVSSPIQTHGVTYIVQRNGLLASCFYLLSLILFIKAVRGPGIRTNLYLASVLTFLFAIWCKEIAYTAPVIMFLYYQCFVSGERRLPGRGLKLVLPYVLVSAASLYLAAPFGAERDAPNWERWEYLLTQSNVLIEYIRLLILPLPGRLNVDVDFSLAGTLWEFPTLLSAVSIVAVLVTAILFLGRSKLLAFSVLWFFVILAPTSSIVPLRDIIVAYRLYLPSLGFYLLLVMGVYKAFYYLGKKKGLEPKTIRLAELTALISIVLFYSACTYEHNKVWKTSISLWEDTIHKSPHKIRPYYGLGHAYQEEGQTMKAWKQYFICKTIHTKMPEIRNLNELRYASAACNNLGMIYIGAELYDVAIPILKEAIRINPKSAKAHRNLGDAYVYTGRLDEAEAEYKLDIRLDPQHSRSYSGLGVVYENKGMPDEAVNAYTKAIETEPDNTELRIRLGHLWLNHSKNPARATYHLREALTQSTDKEDRKRILAKIESMAEISP